MTYKPNVYCSTAIILPRLLEYFRTYLCACVKKLLKWSLGQT